MSDRHIRKTEVSFFYRLRSHGSFALGTFVGVILSAALYIIFSPAARKAAWEHYYKNISEFAPLIISFFSILIAFWAFKEQRRSRQAGTDPVILLYLGNRDDARIMSTLEIINVGAGAAREVQVELLTDISSFHPSRIITDLSKIAKNIRTIPQDRAVSYNFGVGHELVREPFIPPLEFKVTYFDVDGGHYESRQTIDVTELELQRADDPLLSRLTKATEKIAKTLEKSAISSSPLNVITESLESHSVRKQKEHEEFSKRVDAMKENQNNRTTGDS